MAKPAKFKGNQATFDITFEGLDITLEKVFVKEVEMANDYHWAMLSERGGRWTMLTTPGYLVEPLVGDQEILFDRTVTDKPKLESAYAESWDIGVHTALHLNGHKFYSIDQCSDGMRIQYTTSLIPKGEHSQISAIKFKKVAK